MAVRDCRFACHFRFLVAGPCCTSSLPFAGRLEFGHNFLHIPCALVEAILFAQLGMPAAWFGFGAGFAAIGWTLFVYDLR